MFASKSFDFDSPALKGSCACGSIRFRAIKAPYSVTLCHCTRCRKTSGSAYLPFGLFETKSIKLDIAVSNATSTSPSSNEEKSAKNSLRILPSPQRINGVHIGYRAFCAHCGSPIWMKYNCRAELMSVAMGLVDEESLAEGVVVPKPMQRIFLAEKASWDVVPDDDGTEQFDVNPVYFEQEMSKWVDAGCAIRDDVKGEDAAS